MNGLIQWLAQPYPNDSSIQQKLRTGFVISLFVFFFLFLFQPFGLDREFPNKIWVLAGYGGVTLFVYAFLSTLVPFLNPNFFHGENWTVGKEIVQQLILLFFISIGNFAYTATIGYTQWRPQNALLFISFTVMIGIFPITFSIFTKRIRMLKRHENASSQINQGLLPHHAPSAQMEQPPLIELQNEDGKVELSLAPYQILFLLAADNYVEVHCQLDQGLSKHLIRNSLKNLEKSLPQKHFFRCHRSYIVNLQCVQQAEGNSAGLRLSLDHTQQTIPVSRSKTAEFQSKIDSI